MIPVDEKREAIELVREAVSSGARKRPACELLGVSVRTLQRWETECREDFRKDVQKHIPRKLTPEERQKVIEIACSDRFKDLTPYEIVAILAEEGTYIASERTFYRILKSEGLLSHRGNQRPGRKSTKPREYAASGPDQVWCWDITWLPTTVRGIFLYAYMIVDIWTKDIVGWEIHEEENDRVSSEMFQRLKSEYDLDGVILHSDNGNPMRGSLMLMTMYQLGIIPSYSRPRVSDDNPFAESLFKTMKYVPAYPGRFKDIVHAREWMAEFVDWYNTKHRHSAIGYVTPAQRRSGKYREIFKKRNETIQKAKKTHPERWSCSPRVWNCDDVVWLNPSDETREMLLQKSA